MGNFDAAWFWCDLLDQQEMIEEPDFSKVPEERRERVRAQWVDWVLPKPQRWKLWGPQIELYRRSGFLVEVIGPADG